MGLLSRLRRAATADQPPAVALPNGDFYLATWNMPRRFGGMTTVMLQRGRAIVRLGGRPCDILTFAADFKVRMARTWYRANGQVIAGMRIRNFWEELAALDTPALLNRVQGGEPRQDVRPLSPADAHERAPRSRATPFLLRRSTDDPEAIAQIDYLRPDGSLLLSEENRSRDGPGEHRVTLCDHDGRAIGQWQSMQPVYAAWLDTVMDPNAQSFLLIDSKEVAWRLYGYRRPQVFTVPCIHSAHLSTGAVEAPLGVVTRPKKALLAVLDDFDAHVVLTRDQADDLDVLLGPSPHRYVIPNSISADRIGRRPRRAGRHRTSSDTSSLRGVVVSRLVRSKQIDHAVRAVALHNDRNRPVTLDIYGVGEEEWRLRRLVRELGVEDAVRLRGHASDAVRVFSRADFSLHTSAGEGFYLTVLESLAAGCVPLVYDVRYGPSSMISHGDNGYLVTGSDIEAMAGALGEYAGLDEPRQARMRTSAISSAELFDEARVFRRWASLAQEVARSASARRPLAIEAAESSLHSRVSRAGEPAVVLAVRGSADRALESPRAYLRFLGRRRPIVRRHPAELERTLSGWAVSLELPWEDLAWMPEDVVDLDVEIHDRHGLCRRRVPAPPEFTGVAHRHHEFVRTRVGSLALRIRQGTRP